jgi:hypothetical protein
MTMTTTTLTARRPEAAAIGWPRLLGRAGGAEWIKLRSVRSTYGSLVAAVIVTVGIAALAALAITGEFATGSIRTTLAATPARWAVLAAKAAVVGAVTLPTVWSRRPWPPWPRRPSWASAPTTSSPSAPGRRLPWRSSAAGGGPGRGPAQRRRHHHHRRRGPVRPADPGCPGVQ